MKTEKFKRIINKAKNSCCWFFTLIGIVSISCDSPSGEWKNLENGFIQPPDEAKPLVWWHWMNGNITKDGIRKDLEWMHRVGIGGFQNFDASLMTPQIVDQRLTYMTPEWRDAFEFTTRLADSLGLEMAIAGSPGWSESGGPWVKAEDGMKKIVWTETRVKEGDSNIKLAQPPGITGPFQNIPRQHSILSQLKEDELPVFYKDVAVVGIKLPEADKSLQELGAVISSGGGKFSLTQLTDGDLQTTVLLPSDKTKGYSWVQFTFPVAQTIKAITIVGGGEPGLFGTGTASDNSRVLEASEDVVNFKFICNIPAGAVLQQTIAIPATKAKFFRVKIKNPPVQYDATAALLGMDVEPVTPPGIEIAEIVLHPVDVIDRFEEKAAFAPVPDFDSKCTRTTNDVVAFDDIIDLTDKMNSDGTLNWTVPPGEWKVIRFGYSLKGITNHPASPEATGFEVDKLDSAAVKRYFTNYLDQYKIATGGMMGDKGGLQYIITDSWEAGSQNWTGNMLQEFQLRRGYSMIPWMPVLTGQIIKSSDASEQFLFDFRKTLSELVAEYHYDELTNILKQYGMKRYSESHEGGRALIADGMDLKRTAAIPMSAMWTPNPVFNRNDLTPYEADIRESASAAHIYGQNLVAAESLTAFGLGGFAWSYSPENLKPTADLELACGLNRFVIHCSVHQPVDDKIPGIGLGPFGQWFTRHETWAEYALPWTTYLARSSYMLQQGQYVADVVYYYGEDNNIASLFGKKLPDIPEGYSYDFINPDALINLLSVQDGKLVTPSGMSYKILVLDSNAVRMSLPVLQKIEKLVKDGAVICGIVPKSTPSLSDDQSEFKRLVDEIWYSGNPKVITGKKIGDILSSLNIVPDFNYTKSENDTKLLFVHRRAGDVDLYWVNNRNKRVENIEAGFRVKGKQAEIWHPETGKIEDASYSIENGITKVPLVLEENDAVFIIFRKKVKANSRIVPAPSENKLATIEGSWNVKFEEKRGAPFEVKFETLMPWNENTDPGVKYFSGTGTYSKTIDVPAEWLYKAAEIWIDLGDVKNLAEVVVNDKSQGIVWKTPFKVNITEALNQGENKIEIRVTNLWVNRLIGDLQPDATNKITYTTIPFYQANSPLKSSGMMGPVTLISRY